MRLPAAPSQPVNVNSKAILAKKLYDAGVRDIFHVPSNKGWTFASWALGLTLFGGAANLLWLRNWDPEAIFGMAKWQEAFVVSANRIAFVFMTALGTFAILRYAGFVKSIRLIDFDSYGVAFGVSVGRGLPWHKTYYIVKPGDFEMPRYWRLRLPKVNPAKERGGMWARSFEFVKDFMFMRGVVSPVRFANRGRKAMMDPKGITIPAKDFDALMTEYNV